MQSTYGTTYAKPTVSWILVEPAGNVFLKCYLRCQRTIGDLKHHVPRSSSTILIKDAIYLRYNKYVSGATVGETRVHEKST